MENHLRCRRLVRILVWPLLNDYYWSEAAVGVGVKVNLELRSLDYLLVLLGVLARRRLGGLLRPPRRFHLLIVQESKKVNFRKP